MTALWIKSVLSVLLLTLTFGLISCVDEVTFSGSKTANDHQFLVDFDILNTTVEATMVLVVGDKIDTAIEIESGDVDIEVKNGNGTMAYRGNDVSTGTFILTIEEAGTYTFTITGVKAKGFVHFVKE